MRYSIHPDSFVKYDELKKRISNKHKDVFDVRDMFIIDRVLGLRVTLLWDIRTYCHYHFPTFPNQTTSCLLEPPSKTFSDLQLEDAWYKIQPHIYYHHFTLKFDKQWDKLLKKYGIIRRMYQQIDDDVYRNIANSLFGHLWNKPNVPQDIDGPSYPPRFHLNKHIVINEKLYDVAWNKL